MKKFFCCLLLLILTASYSQENTAILTLEEYLAYVKKYHPVVKQANLILREAEANLLKSRGAFDPKIEIDFDKKKFNNTQYYNKLNAAFKIPTWYGIAIKANYQNNDGYYLNPELNTLDKGLYSFGASLSIAKNLFINKRMATLKQAKLFTQQVQETQKLTTNNITFNALITYYNWLKTYQLLKVYEENTNNANTQLQFVKKSFFAGDKPAIDTLEASINYKNRLVEFEKYKIAYIKSKLELSNYLWIENNIPLELQEDIIPDLNTIQKIDRILNHSVLNVEETDIINHPKIKQLQIEKNILDINKKLKVNNLLPSIDLQHNFLTNNKNKINSFSSANYKTGLQINIPLFFRKERGDLKLAKLKLQDINFDIAATQLSLKNKVLINLQEIKSYKEQYRLLLQLVTDYHKLVNGEKKKFEIGESSLFLVNYREAKLLESNIKKLEAEYAVLYSKTSLLKTINKL